MTTETQERLTAILAKSPPGGKPPLGLRLCWERIEFRLWREEMHDRAALWLTEA